MKVQSTGLGKTVMIAQLKKMIKTEFENDEMLQVSMESTEPLHWTIKVFMEPKDIRQAIFMGLKPIVLWKALMAILLGRYSLFKKTKSKTNKDISSKDGTLVQTNKPSKSKTEENNDAKSHNPLASLKG